MILYDDGDDGGKDSDEQADEKYFLDEQRDRIADQSLYQIQFHPHVQECNHKRNNEYRGGSISHFQCDVGKNHGRNEDAPTDDIGDLDFTGGVHRGDNWRTESTYQHDEDNDPCEGGSVLRHFFQP